MHVLLFLAPLWTSLQFPLSLTQPALAPLSLVESALATQPILPLVIWHGLGDSYRSDAMESVKRVLVETIPGLYIHSVYLDEDEGKDLQASLFGNATALVEAVCAQLGANPRLTEGFNAMGFSQGGLFLRAVLETCGPHGPPNQPTLTFRNLITFGSPHMGVTDLPTAACGAFDWACRQRNRLLKAQVWSSFSQAKVIPAQYFRPFATDYSLYLERSSFLARVNNEVEVPNAPAAIANIKSLHNLALVQFANDTVLIPKESAWFMGDTNAEGRLEPFTDTLVYKNDLLGLRSLHVSEKIAFITAPGEHMRFDDDFLRDIAQRYL